LGQLQPTRQFFLRTGFAQVSEEKSFVFIAVFVLEHWYALFALLTDTIPEVPIAGISTQAPNEFAGWYPAHKHLTLSMEKWRRDRLNRRVPLYFLHYGNHLGKASSVLAMEIARTHCDSGSFDMAPLQ